jgi:hypothetical protein
VGEVLGVPKEQSSFFGTDSITDINIADTN